MSETYLQQFQRQLPTLEAATDLPDEFGVDQIVSLCVFASLDLVLANNDAVIDGKYMPKRVRPNLVADAHNLLMPYHEWLLTNSRGAEGFADNKRDLARKGTTPALSRKRIMA